MMRSIWVLLALFVSTVLAHAQAPTPDELNRRNIERRAIEAVIWGMPAVNFELLYQGMVESGGVSWNRKSAARNAGR